MANRLYHRDLPLRTAELTDIMTLMTCFLTMLLRYACCLYYYPPMAGRLVARKVRTLAIPLHPDAVCK